MRPWRLRLTFRRSRVQWALLSVVLLVSLLSSALLATLYLLANATETFAVRSALTDAPDEDVRVVQRIEPDGPLRQVIDASALSAEEFFGDIPYTSSLHVQGTTLAIPREDEAIALGYLATMDGVDEAARLTGGEWPSGSAGGTIEVAVPIELLTNLGIGIGDTVEVAPVFRRSEVSTLTVVGSYQVRQPGTDFWRFDRYLGAGYEPEAIVPFSGGRILTDGFGPLITDLDSLANFDVDALNATYVPDFSDASLAQATSLLQRYSTVERSTVGTIGAIGDNVRVLSSLDRTLGGAIGSLAVTRSSVLVMGLVLLVLAVAALGQTARLMSERRHAEQTLMVARGGSGRQILRLAFIEALVLGLITAGAAPFIARYAYQLISQQDAMVRAGMNQDPGLPVWTWAVTGIVGLLLIIVLVAPLLRRRGSFIEDEQSKARPGKRAAFQRSGLDIALVVLAGLAYWQLQSYESPVITDGGVARLDPLLAAGPALALLAGSLVCVRLIPAASRALEAVAARGRKAVMPLAAWEVGRRSARAVSAILLLTLAVSVGTFAMSYLTTWRLSQTDQAQFRHPADAVVAGLSAPALAQQAHVDDPSRGAAGAPALYRSAVISATLEDNSRRPQDGLSGRDVLLQAVTDASLPFYEDGRLAEEGGSAIATGLRRDVGESRPAFDLPGEPAGIQMDVVADTSETELTDIILTVRAVVQDARGLYATVPLGVIPVDGEPHVSTGLFADNTTLADIQFPISFVGVQAVWLSTSGQDGNAPALGTEGPLEISLSIDNIAAVDVVGEVPVSGVGAIYERTTVDVDQSEPWFASTSNLRADSLEPDEDQIHLEGVTSANALRFRPASVSLTAAPTTGPVALVLTGATLDRLGIDIGEQVRIQVDGAIVFAFANGSVGLLPSETPRAEAMIANYDELALAMIQAGASAPDPDRWWVEVPDENAVAYADSFGDDATVTTRVGLTTSLQEDPLRIATQAALWLVTGAAVLLAAVGFAVHAVVTVRAREIEFAQLRAVGIQRGQLLRIVSAESLLLSILGVVFGVGLGVALGYLVAPLVSVGADGRPPLPSVLVDIPWFTVGLLALEVAAVLLLTVLLVGVLLRRINPAQMLRLGD